MKVYENYLDEGGNCKLQCVRESSGGYNARHRFQSSDDVCALLNNVFDACHLAEEHVWLVCLDIKGHVLGLFEVNKGTVSECVCSPREFFIRALLCGAVQIILAHNHPSGDPSPSDSDISLSKRIYQAGKILGVSLTDFLIIGKDGTYLSFRGCQQGCFSK